MYPLWVKFPVKMSLAATKNFTGSTQGLNLLPHVLCGTLPAFVWTFLTLDFGKARWAMATKKNTSKQRKVKLESTFNLSATSEKSFDQTNDDEDGEDGPLVFVCGKCKLPVGDSLSWDASEDSENQILLKRKFKCSCSRCVLVLTVTPSPTSTTFN